MKMKKIIVSRYKFEDAEGTFIFNDVEVLLPGHSEVTEDTFNQEEDEYYITADTVLWMCDEMDKNRKEKK